MGWPHRTEYATPPMAVARITSVAPSMPAVADVSTAPNAIAGASAAKNRKKTDACDARTERRKNGTEPERTVSLRGTVAARVGFGKISQKKRSASWPARNVHRRKNQGVQPRRVHVAPTFEKTGRGSSRARRRRARRARARLSKNGTAYRDAVDRTRGVAREIFRARARYRAQLGDRDRAFVCFEKERQTDYLERTRDLVEMPCLKSSR